MIENARVAHYQSGWQATAVTPDEYRALYGENVKSHSTKKRVKLRWRFKPGAGWKIFGWLLVWFIVGRLIAVPLVEGVYNYFSKAQEISELKTQYSTMEQRVTNLQKNLEYMKTNSYIIDRSHQLGYIKPNESHVMMVDPSSDGQVYQPRKNKPNPNEYRD